MAEQVWWRTPTALMIWMFSTSILGGVATYVLTKRVEKAGWTQVPAGAIIGGAFAASAINLLAAGLIKGKV